MRLTAALIVTSAALLLASPALAEEDPKPRIGFNSKPLPKGKAEKLGIGQGAKVFSITQGCPSYEAFRIGDVIFAIEGVPVEESEEMLAIYADHLEKGTVLVEFLHKGERQAKELPLFDCPEHRKASQELIAKLPFASPIQLDGTLASWGSPQVAKELVGDLASQAGGQAASMAANQLASKIPMAGGLVSAAARQAAEAAVGAAFSNKITSDQRFATACELGKHLQEHATRADFSQILLAVNTVYAEHEQAIGACMTPTQSVPAPVVGPAAAAAPDLAAQLEKLTTLHAAGALSDEEFAAAKAKLLGL